MGRGLRRDEGDFTKTKGYLDEDRGKENVHFSDDLLPIPLAHPFKVEFFPREDLRREGRKGGQPHLFGSR